jgi:hypothetical protein
MLNVNEKDFRYYSMPIHNPLFKQRRICHRGDVVRWTFTVENPEVIANIVPEPLVYNDNKLHMDINVLKEMVSGFPEGFQLWIEMGIKMQVTFEGEPKTYLCELYANNINVLFIDREFFGMPRVPGRISVERNGNNSKFTLSDYESNRDMLHVSFKPFLENPPPQGPPSGGKGKKPPELIWLKYIPSVLLDYSPDVKQLVQIKYGGPPVIRGERLGEGDIELLEDAPGYLKDAGIRKTGGAIYRDMQFDVCGGSVLHNYI